jgi:hypothetical protein
LVLDGDEVRDGAVFRIAGDLAWSQLPAEAHMPEEIKRWLVFLDLCWGDQGRENDASATTIDDIMVLIAKASRSISHRHRCGVGVSRTDAKVRHTPIGAVGGSSVRTTGTSDPVVARRCLGSQVSARLL